MGQSQNAATAPYFLDCMKRSDNRVFARHSYLCQDLGFCHKGLPAPSEILYPHTNSVPPSFSL